MYCSSHNITALNDDIDGGVPVHCTTIYHASVEQQRRRVRTTVLTDLLKAYKRKHDVTYGIDLIIQGCKFLASTFRNVSYTSGVPSSVKGQTILAVVNATDVVLFLSGANIGTVCIIHVGDRASVTYVSLLPHHNPWNMSPILRINGPSR